MAGCLGKAKVWKCLSTKGVNDLANKNRVGLICNEIQQDHCSVVLKLDRKFFDALLFRDSLLKRKVSHNTVKRNFECIRAIWNFAAREKGISDPNPVANMNYGNGAVAVKRMPIPIYDIRKVQQLWYQKDDDIRWLIALLSDTGMRLAEAAGLAKEDVFLDAEIPYV